MNLDRISNEATPEAKIDLCLPNRTIFKVLGTVLLTYAVIQIFPLITLLFFGALLAVTLDPLVQKMIASGVSRSIAITLITLGLGSSVVIFFGAIVPPLIEQINTLSQTFPSIKHEILVKTSSMTFAHRFVENILNESSTIDTSLLLKNALLIGQIAMGSLVQVLLVLVFTVYFLVDGRHTYIWISAFFSNTHRDMIDRSVSDFTEVIHAYIGGQILTCFLAAIYVYIVLSLMGVPSALALAVLAGIMDILPVLGFVLSTLPAALIALTISPLSGLLVLGLYSLYHALETYLIVPYVYGNRLRISTLITLISILIGAELSGITGAIAALPIAASYPIIERIWLVDMLGRKTIKRHALSE